MTLKKLFQIALKTGNQPKEILERIMDLRIEEEEKLRTLRCRE